MSLCELSEHDRQAVNELRERLKDDLKDEPDYGNDFMLLRWLMGFDYDIDVIVPRAIHAINVRRALKMDEIQFTSVLQIKEYMEKNFRYDLLQYFPGGITGTDNQGNIVVIDPVGRCDPRGLMTSGVRVSEFLRSRLIECEAAASLVRAQERKLGKKCGIVYISDVEGLGWDQIWMPAMHIYVQLLDLMQQQFPDYLIKVLVIRYPVVVHAAYKIIYPVLSKQTRNKIEFVSGDWKTKLSEYIDPTQLPPHWGGVNNNNGIYGYVRMGGKVPREFKYDPSKNVEECKDSDLQSKLISRGSTWTTKIVCKRPGCLLKWFFRLLSGDINFSIQFYSCPEAKPLLIFPRFKISTDYVPEWGQFTCDQVGEYVLEFDNTHSFFRSKTVLYKVSLLDQ